MITKSCPHCGAPITGDKCEYCGAVFYDFSAIDISNEKPTYLKLKLPNGTYFISRAFVETVTMSTEYDTGCVYADSSPWMILPPDRVVNITFRLARDLND